MISFNLTSILLDETRIALHYATINLNLKYNSAVIRDCHDPKLFFYWS